MGRTSFALLAAGALALAPGWAAETSAQSRGGWWDPVVQRSDADAGSILRDAVLGRQSGQEARGRQARSGREGASSARNGNGPPFCRNGAGHPVHGRQWCRDKGWVGNTGWARESWGDVIFGGGTPDRERTVGQPTIGDILGDVILGRLSRAGRDNGLSGSLEGRWLPVASGGSVLQLRMGGAPLAELADLDRDGRADVVLLNYDR